MTEAGGELTKIYKDQLSNWMGCSKEFQLLYKATRDGMSPAIFHQKCDNQGATVIVAWNTDEYVFGGYTTVDSKACACASVYTNHFDRQAFLFRLDTEDEYSPRMLPIVKPEQAVFHLSSSATGFGNQTKPDMLIIPGGVVANTGGQFATGLTPTHFQFGSVYDSQGLSLSDVTNNNFVFVEVEVYRVSDLKRLDKAWREHKMDNTETLKKGVADYVPVEDSGVKQAQILLVGSVGAGKSSYFNTINSIYRGHVTSQASTGSAEHSLTTLYRKYQVRSGSTYLKFRLCDTRGMEDTEGLDPSDVAAILEGHVPDRYSFNPFTPIKADAKSYIKNPTSNDQIHCVAFVIDSGSVDVMSESILTKFKLVQKLANQRGIPQVILLTKVDQIALEVEQNLSSLLYTSQVADVVDQVSQLIGLPRGHVLPVKSYEKETELDETVDKFALLSLQQMLRFADDYMYDILDN